MGRGWGLDPTPHGNSAHGIQQVKLQQVASLDPPRGACSPKARARACVCRDAGTVVVPDRNPDILVMMESCPSEHCSCSSKLTNGCTAGF